MIHYERCPVCLNGPIRLKHSVKDHSISNEVFEVWICKNCSAAFTQNVPSAVEIGRYYASENYISHSDTREGIVNRLYHQVRTITLAHKRKLVQRSTGMVAGKLLDIGAGTGAFANEMKQAGWDVTALEPMDTARQQAEVNYGIALQNENELFNLSQQFDAITLWHVLEHVHSLHEYGDRIKKLLKPDGKVFIAVPNFESKDANVYGDAWAAWDVPRHLYHFSPESMATFLSMHGLKLVNQKPMWFDSFYVSMLSEPYKTGRPNLIRAMMRGLSSNFKALADVKKCSSIIYIATNS